MATNSWISGGATVAQVQTYAFGGTWEADDIIRLNIGVKTVDVVAGSTVTNTVIDNVVTAWNLLSSSIYPEFAEITASHSSSNLVLTMDSAGAGKPFTCTITPLEADGTAAGAQTIGGAGVATTGTTSTTSAGPYDASTAANWSQGRIPAHTLTAPVQSNASVTTGGTLTDTQAYFWVITATNANGETVKSNEKTLTISAPNQTAVLSWAAVPNATGYKIYRGTSAGVYGASSLLTTISSGSTLTYNDTGTATGAGQPVSPSTAIGDTVVIDREGSRLKYGLNQSTITVPQRLITASDVEIGLPKTNTDSGTSYPEYRADYWQMTATVDFIDTDSSMLKLDHGANQTAVEMDSSGSSRNNVPAVLLKGTHASNTWNLSAGNAGIAYFAGELASVATLNLGPKATAILGSGCTNTTLNNYGGKLYVNSAVGTALNHPSTNGGTTTASGSGAVAQLTMQGGTCNYNTTGTLGGTTVLANNAQLNFDGDQQIKTVTNPIELHSSQASVKDSNGVVTTNGATKQYTLKYVDCVNNHTPKPGTQAVYTPL